MKKLRLDQLIYERGLSESRQRAKTTVMSGLVFVNGKLSDKPGTQVAQDSVIEIKGERNPYVSRGGLKLERALDIFPTDPKGLVCLDCGASTGGFTDCLLKRGALRVYAVDVGYGQLAWSLREDSRVVVMERTNIRYVTGDSLGEKVGFAVCDLSFISLKLVLEPISRLLDKDAPVICLIKPQFEAGKEKVGKKGVVRDPDVHMQVLTSFQDYSQQAGFAVSGMTHSPIKGPEGNIEFLGFLTRKKVVEPVSILEVVEQALFQFNGCEVK